ncbi:cytosine/adenosine deaminase [Salinisphaera sp. PC39]
MSRALDLAARAESEGEVPVGALLVRDGELVAEGWNRPIGSHDATGHAEIEVLREAGRKLGNYRLPGTTLYVTLEPCVMCAGAIVHARVERLVYGAADPRTGAVVSVFNVLDEASLNHRVRYEGGVLAEESAELLRRFFRARRN